MGFVLFLASTGGIEVGRYSSVMLIVMGFWASYEIRMLAALKKELNELQGVQESLRQNVTKLDEEVAIFDQQNEEFREETGVLMRANSHFKQELFQLSETAKLLEGSQQEFENRNGQLRKEVDIMQKSNLDMKENLANLSQQTDEMANQNEQYTDLQSHIEKYARKNNDDLTEALVKQEEMCIEFEQMLVNSSSSLLQQLATDMEFQNTDEGVDGMAEKEYDYWFSRIPKRFQNELIRRHITFDKIAGEDCVIQFDEITAVIDALLYDKPLEIDHRPS